jgi:G3E family GTPase
MSVSHIPTNIITGALGAGKTTLIQSLLKKKPEQERWAVLVNEFGEIGIDGSIVSGQSSDGVFVKEVPGGCMCCTSGLPMQIALNILIARAKPQRLLIEPTGLGHPKEVLQTLSQPQYAELLDVQATLTLIDARKLAQKKWREHATFQEQVQIADVIVLTKSDLYDGSEEKQLAAYLASNHAQDTARLTAAYGELPLSVLYSAKSSEEKSGHIQIGGGQKHQHHSHSHSHENTDSQPISAPKTGFISVCNQGEGYYSRGWVCATSTQFNFEDCRALFEQLNVERLKAVLRTDQGIFSFNRSDNICRIEALNAANDSRIEFIVDSAAKADAASETLIQTLQLVKSN